MSIRRFHQFGSVRCATLENLQAAARVILMLKLPPPASQKTPPYGPTFAFGPRDVDPFSPYENPLQRSENP